MTNPDDHESGSTIHKSNHKDLEKWVELEDWVDRLVVNGEREINLPPHAICSSSECKEPDAAASSSSQFDALLAVQRHEGQESFDASLAKEMDRLSLEELNARYEDIHGVAPTTPEDPEFVAKKLVEIQEVLNQMLQQHLANPSNGSSSSVEYYRRALEEEPLYVQDPKFRLMFLRADFFDTQKAADRLVRFLEKKVEHFGMQTLCRDVMMKDLSPDELKTLQSGSLQLLPYRDRCGRLVIFDPFMFGPKQYTDIRSHYKCFWYKILCAFNDEETQKKGYVHVFWFLDKFRGLEHDFNSKCRREIVESLHWLPMRPPPSLHICINTGACTGMDRMVKELMARIIIAISPAPSRYNVKVHKEPSKEAIVAKLMTYGIPVQLGLPLNSKTGSMTKTAAHKQWLAKQKEKEDSIAEDGGLSWNFVHKIDLPTNQDVLLGRGMVTNQHPGNISYRRLIESMLDDYANANKMEKAAMTWRVVQVIQQNGARFLKQHKAGSHWWVEATDKEARQKVGKAFVAQGSARKEQALQQQQQQYIQQQQQAAVVVQLREDGKRFKG